jgi:hypothetical protein
MFVTTHRHRQVTQTKVEVDMFVVTQTNAKLMKCKLQSLVKFLKRNMYVYQNGRNFDTNLLVMT